MYLYNCFRPADNIFGKCIPTTGVDVEDIEKTPLTDEQSHALATMLEELQGAGLGWDHPYVQCRIQGTLFTLQKHTSLPPNLCANLAPNPTIIDPASAMAFVRFTPPREEEQLYYPPLKKQNTGGINTIFRQLQLQDRRLRHDPMELAHFEELDVPQIPVEPAQVENPSVMDVFLESERARMQHEQAQREAELETERKNALRERVELYQMLAASEPDPQPFQRNTPAPPVAPTVTISALDKLERIVEQDSKGGAPLYLPKDLDDSSEQFFRDDYRQFKRLEDNQPRKQPTSEAQHSFFRELAAEEGLRQEPLFRDVYSHGQVSQPLVADWLIPAYKQRPTSDMWNMDIETQRNNFQEEDLEQRARQNSLLRNSLTPFEEEAMLSANTFPQATRKRAQKPDRVYTEAGLVYVPEDDDASEILAAELQTDKTRELLENMLGFKRRERLDVKKPGPLITPPSLNSENHEPNNKTGTLFPDHLPKVS